MTRKEFMDKFFDLCKDAQEEIPPNVIAEILRDYADRLDQMKNFFSFILGVLLFFSPLTVQAEELEIMPQDEIAEAPALEPMTEKQLNDLFGEEMYIGETDWRGNKLSNKRDYSKKKKIRQFQARLKIYKLNNLTSQTLLGLRLKLLCDKGQFY